MIPELWKTGALALSVALIGGLIGWLAVARANLKAELAEERMHMALCQNANANWVAQGEAISASTRTLQKEADERQREAVRAVAAAGRIADEHTRKAYALLARKEAGDECQAAKKLLADYLESRK